MGMSVVADHMLWCVCSSGVYVAVVWCEFCVKGHERRVEMQESESLAQQCLKEQTSVETKSRNSQESQFFPI